MNNTQVYKESCIQRNRKGICLLVNQTCKKLTKNYTRYCLFYKHKDD